MSTSIPEPTIAELERAFHEGVRAKHDRHADDVEGSVYDHFAGVSAVLWSRQAKRDTDMYRAIYLGSAEGDDLTRLLDERYAFARVADTFGIGVAKLLRADASLLGGTVWRGTRIQVVDGSASRMYLVTEDVEAADSDTEVTVPVRAEQSGPGTSVAFPGERLRASVFDPLWDPTWVVTSIACDAGTSFEPAPDARARLRQSKRDARVGHIEAMAEACKQAGVSTAVFFASDYAGDSEDAGLNMAYVGDDGFNGTPGLVRAATVALENCRVLGDQLQVRPLASSELVVRANAHLWDAPARVNQEETRRALQGAVVDYFSRQDAAVSYQLDAIGGAMIRASRAIQYVAFDTPTSDAGVVSLVGGRLVFPATLTRYVVQRQNVHVALLPPV